jgi:hypothetical protein
MTTLNPDKLIAELKRAGLAYHEMPSWRTRGHGTLNVRDLGIHDTVTGAQTDPQVAQTCWAGRSDLAGPLYNIMIGQTGQVWLVTAQRSWNIGKTRQERITTAIRALMPYDRELPAPDPDDFLSGNDTTLGIACATRGAGPYTTAQYKNTVLVVVAVGRALGWSADDTARSTLGHSEATRRKIDPQFDMGTFRRLVKAGFAPVPTPPIGIIGQTVTGKLPLLHSGMADPIKFGGGNYVGRVQLLLRIPNTGHYDAATVAAVKTVVSRLNIATVDKTGNTVDSAVWHRLYGMV